MWVDITPNDLKMFIAHNIIMSIVKKSDLEKYWSKDPYTKLPFLENSCQEIGFSLYFRTFTLLMTLKIQDMDVLAMTLFLNSDHSYQWLKTTFAMCIDLMQIFQFLKPAAHSKIICASDVTIQPSPIDFT